MPTILQNGIARLSAVTSFLTLTILSAFAQKVDYSVTSVPEEAGLDFVQITKESDYVCMPPVKRSRGGITWLTNKIIDVAPDGQTIAYLSLRNNTSNIFVKSTDKQGTSNQRTNRSGVMDFSYSPDGKQICFSESKGKTNQIFITDARQGYVCRQITSGASDYSPVYSPDMKTIFFARMENRGISIWGYDIEKNYLSSYTPGMNPTSDSNANVLYLARESNGKGEIWKVDLNTGVEECVVSDNERTFFSPQLSPDGAHLVLVGGTKIENGNTVYWNTDIYTCKTDGTNLQQLTHHAADDLSPVWSSDGRFIYFISQRGNADGIANVWRINSNI